MLWVWIIVSVACAALTAWVFSANGRPAWVGAILGLIFGLPALVISLIVFMVGSRKRRGATATTA